MRAAALPLIGLLATTGCGRFAFDPVSGDGSTGDVPVMPAGALAWWKLDEGSGTMAADAIGTADAAFEPGPMSSPAWTAGHTGTAAVGFASVEGGALLVGALPVFANLPALTVTAWVRPSSIATTGTVQCIMDKSDGAAAGWTFAVSDDATGDVSFELQYMPMRQSRISVGGQLADNQWSHVAATWDGSPSATGIHLFVGGAELAYASATDAPGPRGDDSALGLSINCGTWTMPGIIDDVRIYDRVLSVSEIALTMQ